MAKKLIIFRIVLELYSAIVKSNETMRLNGEGVYVKLYYFKRLIFLISSAVQARKFRWEPRILDCESTWIIPAEQRALRNHSTRWVMKYKSWWKIANFASCMKNYRIKRAFYAIKARKRFAITKQRTYCTLL